jgi:ABC-type branched-subunit amino acid transport system substrate-binding protein
MIGPSLSQLALAVVPVTNKEKVPLVTTAASTQLTPEVGPYHFSMSATSVDWATAMVDYAVDTAKAKSGAVLGDNGAFSKDAAAALKRHMAERNLSLTGEEEYAFRTTDMTPQMLSLRRSNPDLILFSVTSPEDFARILTTLGDINWDVPLVGAVSVTAMAAAVVKQVGTDPLRHTSGLGYLGLTYCGDAPLGQSDYAKFQERLKAFSPETYDKIPHGVALFWYDGVYILKAAIEGAGTTQGDKVAAWLEENGSSVHAIIGPLQPSKARHFLLGPKALAIVERPYEFRADGLQKRAGC